MHKTKEEKIELEERYLAYLRGHKDDKEREIKATEERLRKLRQERSPHIVAVPQYELLPDLFGKLRALFGTKSFTAQEGSLNLAGRGYGERPSPKKLAKVLATSPEVEVDNSYRPYRYRLK